MTVNVFNQALTSEKTEFMRAILNKLKLGLTGGFDAPPPRPSTPVCVVGDIHGMDRLLRGMIDYIGEQQGSEKVRIVFVGDLIDRGMESAKVLDRMRRLVREADGRIIVLMGNHERMLLDFLRDPLRVGMRWIDAGGSETLRSFGIDPYGTTDLGLIAGELRSAIGGDIERWLRTLPLYWQEGNLAVTHAGATPNLPMARQTERALLWGDREFGSMPRKDGLWIAHGHTIVEQPVCENGRISVDTGAFQSGLLSAAWIDRAGVRFISVRD